MHQLKAASYKNNDIRNISSSNQSFCKGIARISQIFNRKTMLHSMPYIFVKECRHLSYFVLWLNIVLKPFPHFMQSLRRPCCLVNKIDNLGQDLWKVEIVVIFGFKRFFSRYNKWLWRQRTSVHLGNVLTFLKVK